MFTPITNHAEQAIARLIGEYADAEKFHNLISSLIVPIQEIEGVLTDLNVAREIQNAVGQQLDNIGKIVGRTRMPGDSDDIYRLKLFAQIKINTSQGQPEQIIQVYQLFTQAPLVLLDEYPRGEVIVESQYTPPDQATVDLLLGIIGEVLPAGVRCNSIVAFDPTEAFAFDGNLPGLGFGDDSDPLVGGKFADEFLRDTFFGFSGDNPTIEGFGSDDDPLVGGLIAGVD